MSRYDPINLALVPPPASVQVLSFDTTYAAWLASFTAIAATYNVTYNVGTLRSDPMGWMMSAAAYREMLKRGEINDAIKAVLLPTALGGDLDQVCADFNIVRRVLVPADPTTSPPTAAVMELDADLRARRALAPEALSSAGPPGAYHFFAMQASADVRDVGVYGPEQAFVQPGQVVLVVQSVSGPGGVPPIATLQAVASLLGAWEAPDIAGYVPPTPAQLDANTLRPDTDHVIVRAVAPTYYSVSGVLTLPPGPNGASVLAAATAAIQAYCAAQNIVNGEVTLSSLIAAGRMLNADGTSPALDFVLTSPLANVVPGPLGTPVCTGVVLTPQVSNG